MLLFLKHDIFRGFFGHLREELTPDRFQIFLAGLALSAAAPDRRPSPYGKPSTEDIKARIEELKEEEKELEEKNKELRKKVRTKRV